MHRYCVCVGDKLCPFCNISSFSIWRNDACLCKCLSFTPNRRQWTIIFRKIQWNYQSQVFKMRLWTLKCTWNLGDKVMLGQGFLLSALLTFWAGLFFVVGDCLVHWKCSNTLLLPDTSSTPIQTLTPRIASLCSLEGRQNCFSSRISSLEKSTSRCFTATWSVSFNRYVWECGVWIKHPLIRQHKRIAELRDSSTFLIILKLDVRNGVLTCVEMFWTANWVAWIMAVFNTQMCIYIWPF